MIRKIFNFITSFLNEIYIFESKCNKKKIKYKSYLLKEYRNLKQIKNRQIIKYIKVGDKDLRFKKKQVLFALFHGQQVTSFGWMNKKSRWFISEINRGINIKNSIILYDFFTFPNLRNKGYYCKILELIKNIKTKKIYIIYSLKNNESSTKGILKAKFVLRNRMKRLF